MTTETARRDDRCPVCGAASCDGCGGTVCNPQAAVDALLDSLTLRLGVDIAAEADAAASAHVAQVGEQAGHDAIARWFRAIRDGGQRGARPSCPNCGGWLYVDVDARDGAVELHAHGTREIVCLNCARRWYVWVGKRS